MCLDVDCEYDMIRDPIWRTARKEHTCDECRRTIEPRERYWTYVSKEWGADHLDTWRMCAHCRGTIDLGAALTGCPKSYFWDQVHSLEADDGGFVGDIIVNHDLTDAEKFKMLRTVVGRRKQWRRRDGSLLPLPYVDAAA